MNFDILNGELKRDAHYCSIYAAAFQRKLFECAANDFRNRQTIKQAIFYGVKFINTLRSQNRRSRTSIAKGVRIVRYIIDLISRITPRELLEIFPVDKIYDGKRLQLKDYYSTMNALENHGFDKPMGKAVDKLLWDYQSCNIDIFVAQAMSLMSALNQLEGRKGIFEISQELHNKLSPTVNAENKGRTFL